MGRKKVTMNLICSRSVRRTTFKRRRSSLLKKASELTKLCGKPVCLVVCDGPDNSSPVVWPSQEEAAQMLSMAKSMPEGKQNKKRKLVREIAEMEEQVQNLDRENLHLEAMLQMQLKEALGRIDSQLTITPLSVAPESSMVQPLIIEDGEHLMMPIHEEGMLWDYEIMHGSFYPLRLPLISMPSLLDASNLESGGIIQTQSLNSGAAGACGREEKETLQWDGEDLEPILEENCLPDDGELLTPILDKYRLMEFLDMYEPASSDLDTARHEASLLEEQILDAPNESVRIFSAVVASGSERCSTSCRASAAVAPVPEGSDVHSLDDDFDDVLLSFIKNME